MADRGEHGRAGARRPLDVLVVDDSALVRRVLAMALPRAGAVDVRTAPDPIVALDKIEQQRPDVILLDLRLPRMDGVTFVKQLMREVPIPVVVYAGVGDDDAELMLRALHAGAVDVVCKPRVAIRALFESAAAELVERLEGAAFARLGDRRHGRRGRTPRPVRIAGGSAPVVMASPRAMRRDDVVVAVGASTGGTEALVALLAGMPGDAPPIVIVQHMPEPFTTAFARRLDAIAAIEVRIAEHGALLAPGRALVARGDRHLRVDRGRDGRLCVRLDGARPVSRHRPSVDVLFESVAAAMSRHAVGVLLTGMGSDGASGLLAMRRRGAHTIAQDEATSVVFGMPRAAIRLGAAELVLPLERIAHAVLAHARG